MQSVWYESNAQCIGEGLKILLVLFLLNNRGLLGYMGETNFTDVSGSFGPLFKGI